MRRNFVLARGLIILASLLLPATVYANTLDLYKPFGMVIKADGTTYTANPFRSEIDKFDPAGTHLLTYGTFGTGEGAFRGCSGVAVDSQGRVYVADTGNSRLVRLLDSGAGLNWDGVIVGSVKLDFPRDIFIDSRDRIFVVDESDTVKAFDTLGAPLGIFAAGRSSFGGTGSLPGQLRNPHGVFLDPDGNIFVADTNNDRIQKFDPQGNFLWARGTAGTGPGEFLQPRDITLNSEGRIYVADAHNHRIQEFAPEGAYLSDSGSGNWGLDGVPNAETLAMGPGDQLH